MNPVAFKIGPVDIYWYGITAFVGVLAMIVVAAWEAKRRGEDPDDVWNGVFVVGILALIGARLYHVISSPTGYAVGLGYYLQNPLAILDVRAGGLGIYGAVAGGILGIFLYARWKGLSLPRWLDIVMLGAPLGQAIGRWGNYFNQELYGYPTDLPWGTYIPLEKRLPGYEGYERFHPAFLYESAWNLLIFGLMLWATRRLGDRMKDGDVLLIYLILYPMGRILVESLRPDSWTIGPVRVAQAVSLALIAAAGALLAWRHLGIGHRGGASTHSASPGHTRGSLGGKRD